MAVQFYETLFHSVAVAIGDFPTGFFPQISVGLMLGLEADHSINETKKALRGMGSLKALGPDGFHPRFFKHTWGTTGSAIHTFAQGILRGKEVSEEIAKPLLVLIPK